VRLVVRQVLVAVLPNQGQLLEVQLLDLLVVFQRLLPLRLFLYRLKCLR
jgi:hypothetical protein